MGALEDDLDYALRQQREANYRSHSLRDMSARWDDMACEKCSRVGGLGLSFVACDGRGEINQSQLAISRLMVEVHLANAKWWQDLHTGEPIERNVGELLMLTVSELAEAMEGHRKGLMDDKLPHRPMIEVELADALIRILDMAAGLDLDLAGAYVEKMAYNAQRADHQHANRLAPGGKKY